MPLTKTCSSSWSLPSLSHPSSYVFKLADFGTARELGPDETFISLHGTEEYLYPGMYERALVNPGKRHKFSAQVRERGREVEREGGREEGKGGREGGREEGSEGGRQGSEGGRQGREGGREEW